MSGPPLYFVSVDPAFSGPCGVAHWSGAGGAVRLMGVRRLMGNASFGAWVEALGWLRPRTRPDQVRIVPSLVIIEEPFVPKGRKRNFATAIKMGRGVGRIEAAAQAIRDDMRIELRLASQWRAGLRIKEQGDEAAKARCRSLVRALGTPLDDQMRRPTSGPLGQVYWGSLANVGMTKADTDRCEAVGLGLGYAIVQGWRFKADAPQEVHTS